VIEVAQEVVASATPSGEAPVPADPRNDGEGPNTLEIVGQLKPLVGGLGGEAPEVVG
jgi:hypothetical protein